MNSIWFNISLFKSIPGAISIKITSLFLTSKTHLSVIINTNTWTTPNIFNWLSDQCKIDSYEMFRTFNCGIGLILCVEKNNAEDAINRLHDNGENAWLVGKVIKNNKQPRVQLI